MLPGCAPLEPINGCVIDAGSFRETLRARALAGRAIPARILLIRSADGAHGHAALVYHLDPEGWCVYDDTAGSRRLNPAQSGSFPDPLAAARQAFPTWRIARPWCKDAASR